MNSASGKNRTCLSSLSPDWLKKRGSATVAQSLYRETEQSIATREEQKQLRKYHAASSPAPDKRPDKKARRHIIRFIKRED